ncbi:VOC family protein [Bradyrhizobium sp. G127]|jgi:predicted enzyme related to lactoylglutathione lyase|uniref:VOC family protein n=1 Tax=Bradyrhizobium sp. G127 TaxID=2904800 RepID=UPI0032DF6EDD
MNALPEITCTRHGAGNFYARVLGIAWRHAEQITQAMEITMTSHGHFHWNELVTPDPERAKQFYQNAIGWTFAATPMSDGAIYWTAHADNRPVAGIFPTNRPAFEGIIESWMPYLAVDDVDARVEKAVASGAQLMRPLFDVPGVGRIAILTEPGGAGIGWITPVG